MLHIKQKGFSALIRAHIGVGPVCSRLTLYSQESFDHESWERFQTSNSKSLESDSPRVVSFYDRRTFLLESHEDLVGLRLVTTQVRTQIVGYSEFLHLISVALNLSLQEENSMLLVPIHQGSSIVALLK